MLGRFPRLPPRRVCRLSSPPREESGPKGIVGTSETGTNERTVHRPSNTWHLESVPVPPPATICAWFPGCTSFISALHRRLNRRRVVISRRGPLTKKQKGKKTGEFPPRFRHPLSTAVRSWVSHPPCQTANTEKSLNLFFLQCKG